MDAGPRNPLQLNLEPEPPAKASNEDGGATRDKERVQLRYLPPPILDKGRFKRIAARRPQASQNDVCSRLTLDKTGDPLACARQLH